MKEFRDFMRKNRAAIYAKARNNGTYNENGELVASKDDPWMQGTFHEPDLPGKVNHIERKYKAAAN